MEEKLLALLVAKFVGVPEATLKRIAAKKAGSITDETQLQSVADGIDYGQIVQSEVDSKITDSNKKAVQNYETTHKLKDGKPIQTVEPGKTQQPDEDDEAPKWAKTLIEQNKTFSERLSAIENSKSTETRQQKLEAALKDAPEAFKSKSLKDFKRMSFDTDEAFDEYLTEVGTDITALNQEFANKGFESQSAPRFSKTGASEDDEFAAAMTSINQTDNK